MTGVQTCALPIYRECVEVQADRALAIAETVAAAGPHDVVLLAGKGHEDYQEIAGVKHPFDDRVHADRALQARAAKEKFGGDAIGDFVAAHAHYVARIPWSPA